MKVDQKIVGRLQELIDLAQKVLGTRRSGVHEGYWRMPYDEINDEMANQWGVSCLGILERVFGKASPHYSKFDALFPEITGPSTFIQALGILKAAKDDYENGYLFNTRVLIEADVFDDLLEQAEYLLSKGYYQPAAIIAGAVLEDGLKKLCQRRGVSLPAKPTIDPMNVDLAKDGAYNSLVQKRVTMLADLRNKAAHGKFSEFSEADVKDMLAQIRSFMENHFC